MAHDHNALDYGPELGRAIGRFTGLGTLEDGMYRLGETLTPVVDQWGLPELAFLRGETLCAWPRLRTATALENAGVSLGNPTGSNVIAVVEAVGVIAPIASTVELYMHNDDDLVGVLGASSQGGRRDRRGGQTVSRLVVRYGSQVGIVNGTVLERSKTGGAATEMKFFRCPPLILAPGDACAVWDPTVNTALDVSFKWRERRFRPGETVAR